MRKFFSVLLCIILIISICICSSVSGSALFIADDLLYAVGISMAASVLLSIGIAAVSGSDSQYTVMVTELGKIVWEQMIQDYTQAEIFSMITIQNGKAYFRCPESLYTKIKNFALMYDWNSVHYQANISVPEGTLIHRPNNDNIEFTTYDKNLFSIAVRTTDMFMTVNSSSYQLVYTKDSSSSSFYLHLSGDDFIVHNPARALSFGSVTVISPLSDRGTFYYGEGKNGSNYSTTVDNTNRFYARYSTNIFTTGNGYCGYQGMPSTTLTYVLKNDNTYDIKLGNTVIANVPSYEDYSKNCLLVGYLLCNNPNEILNVNTDSTASTVEGDVETETFPPAIPGNRIGTNQTALIPIPSTFEDPSLPGVPLPQRTVKNRVKRGQDLVLVPDLPSLEDKTPQDLGVLVVNNTDIQDTTISPTLETSIYGDNSTTFVIVPQVPINTPIPNDDNQPLVSSPYPDVINPGNETITVTANDDIFPTANNPAETTARPSVSVSNPDEVASSAAVEVVEGVSEIASQAVKDIAEPLSPSDIEKGANRMKLMPQLIQKFPFCIPFDFYNAINQFSAPAEVPQFDIPISIESLDFDYNVHVDLTNFETAAKISRWFFSVAWVVTLIFLTRKVIWK